jgi:hypothetical protein
VVAPVSARGRKPVSSTGGPPTGTRSVSVSVPSFDVELQAGLDQDGTVHARITPVTDIAKIISESGLELSDAVFEAITDLIVDLAKRDVEHGEAAIVE